MPKEYAGNVRVDCPRPRGGPSRFGGDSGQMSRLRCREDEVHREIKVGEEGSEEFGAD